MNTITKNFYLVYFLIFIILFSLIYYLFSIAPQEVKNIIKEKSLIERFTEIGYFMAGIVSFLLAKQGLFSGGYLSSLFIFTLGLRELDFHAKFTTMNITKISFYTSSTVPILEKIIVSIIMLFLLTAFLVFMKKYFLVFIKDLVQGSQYAIFVLTPIILLSFSKLCDGYKKHFKTFNIEITDVLKYRIKGVEEVFELSAPFFFYLHFLSL